MAQKVSPELYLGPLVRHDTFIDFDPSPQRFPALVVTLASKSLTPIELMVSQLDCETIALPTGATIFQRGAAAKCIYGVRRGIVELVDPEGEKTCFRPGEFFCYPDIVWHNGDHRSDAHALTPVEVLRLDRLRFMNLLHNHPTLALLLIGQQHDRLREQRTSGTCCY
jgi:CRP/FNR family transcriptional regulator, cyclic AMP receptor protein